MSLEDLFSRIVGVLQLCTESQWHAAMATFGGHDKAADDPDKFLRSLEGFQVHCANGKCPLLTEYQRSRLHLDDLSQLRIVIGSNAILPVYPVQEGGQGSVYLARLATPVGAHQLVALKIPKLLTEEAATRFQKECRLLCEIKDEDRQNGGEHIVKGILFETRDRPVLVMDWLAGPSLCDVVSEKRRKGKRLSLRQSLRLIRGVLIGLRFLHSRGIIHRDIKPKNLIHVSKYFVSIVDLGYAKDLEHPETAEGSTFGSPYYTAPECHSDASAVCPRADVYSACATLYFLLTGRPPFSELYLNGMKKTSRFLDDRATWMKGEAEWSISTLSGIRPEIPPSLLKLIQLGLRPKPDERPSTVVKLITTIDAVLASIKRCENTLHAFRAFHEQCRQVIFGACKDIDNYTPSETATAVRDDLHRRMKNLQKKYPDSIRFKDGFFEVGTLLPGMKTYRKGVKDIATFLSHFLKDLSTLGANRDLTPSTSKRATLSELINRLQQKIPDIATTEHHLEAGLRQLTHKDYPH